MSGAFELAAEVSPFFAELSDLVSRDHAFLENTLRGVLETDAFTKRLWDVYVACGAQAGRARRQDALPLAHTELQRRPRPGDCRAAQPRRPRPARIHRKPEYCPLRYPCLFAGRNQADANQYSDAAIN